MKLQRLEPLAKGTVTAGTQARGTPSAGALSGGKLAEGVLAGGTLAGGKHAVDTLGRRHRVRSFTSKMHSGREDSNRIYIGSC